MSEPTYSIAIPVYRRVPGFREALASALAVQGCQEILVVDDGSEHDEFERIAASFGDPRVRYVRNERNLGLFGNWNRGVQLATGEFVSILCSDDFVAPDAYALFAQALRADPKIDLFFGSFCTFHESIDEAFTHKVYPPGRMDPLTLLAEAVQHGPVFPVLSIGRRSKLLELPFVAQPHSGNDWLWIYQNATRLNLWAVDRPINYWRRHPDQDANRSESVTMDCWPLMYVHMAEQLHAGGHPLAAAAMRRAKGVVLSWLLNDFAARVSHLHRLRSPEADTNPFLREALTLVRQDWLLSRLLNSDASDHVIYHLGRLARRTGWYPAS